MFCTKCGLQAYPGDRFCAGCGASLTREIRPTGKAVPEVYRDENKMNIQAQFLSKENNRPLNVRSQSNSLKLKELSLKKIIIKTLLYPFLIILLDVILPYIFSGFVAEYPEFDIRLILYFAFISLGIYIADQIYKFVTALTIIPLSFINLFLIRLILVSIFAPASYSQAMENTLKESLVVFVAAIIFVFLFRFFETKIDYAEIINTFESTDPLTKKQIVSGTCNKCKGITIVGKQRTPSFLGKSTEYFCTNCNRFISGNPFNQIFLGLIESIISFFFIIGFFSMSKGSTSSVSSIFLFIFLVGIGDGIKRMFQGLKAFIKKNRIAGSSL